MIFLVANLVPESSSHSNISVGVIGIQPHHLSPTTNGSETWQIGKYFHY